MMLHFYTNVANAHIVDTRKNPDKTIFCRSFIYYNFLLFITTLTKTTLLKILSCSVRKLTFFL